MLPLILKTRVIFYTNLDFLNPKNRISNFKTEMSMCWLKISLFPFSSPKNLWNCRFPGSPTFAMGSQMKKMYITSTILSIQFKRFFKWTTIWLRITGEKSPSFIPQIDFIHRIIRLSLYRHTLHTRDVTLIY